MTLPILKLAVYYGWLSDLNLHHSNALVVQDLNAYDVVVIGDGIADPNHGDYSNSVFIIENTAAKIYGHVDTTKTLSALKAEIDQWANMCGVDGIFFNQFGFDFGNTRTEQNARVDYAHAKGLKVMVNSWNVDDVFKKSQDIDHHLNIDDWYLAESHYLINGEYQTVSDWETKSDKMVTYQSSAQMACLGSTTETHPFNQTKWNNTHLAHTIYGFKMSGIGEPNYSATSALLPFRVRPVIHGTKFIGNLVKKANNVYERSTNVGVHIDTSANTSGLLLD